MAVNQITVADIGGLGSPNLQGATPQNAFGGHQGDQYVSEVHGKSWSANRGGGHFYASTAAAGVTIPISSATAATYVIYNPIGSGVRCELVDLTIGATSATLVVSPIGFGVIKGLTLAPTGLTALTVQSGMIGGGGVNQVQAFSAATLANAATLFDWFFSVSATSGLGPNFTKEFDGKRGLMPGSLVHVVGTAAQTQATAITSSWNEWPL